MAQANCSSAATVALNSITTVPSFNAENGTAPTQLCGLGYGVGTKGKWYKFIAAQNSNITVKTSASVGNADTRLIVYSGDCSSLVCIGSNDDSNDNYSELTFGATTGTTYTIAFDDRFSPNGFKFSVTEGAPTGPDRLSFTSTYIPEIINSQYSSKCIVDMNGDYLDDIVSAVDGTHLSITYQNAGGTFTTSTYTVANTGNNLPSWSIAAGDYDNNGYNDLIYGSGSGVAFIKANSNGTGYSSDKKTQSFLVQRTNFIDINNDGKLDAFVCDDNAPNRYYLNDGTNLNHNQGGIGDFPTGGNYASNWFDFDNDGDVDMYLAKCGGGGSGPGGNIDQLLKNNGNGTFTNVASDANMANAEQTWSGACGDFNNDGWMDVVVGVNSSTDGYTNVKKNNGNGTFTSVTAGSGYDTNTSLGREYVAQDFDNDGFLDILGSGNTIMFGDGNFHFTPNPNAYLISAYDRPIGDLNNDGFLDIQNGSNVLFNNGNTNQWLNVNLRGIQSNRNGIGARVEIHGTFGQQIRYVQSGTGFQNMNTLTAHFGLGAAPSGKSEMAAVTQLIIKWPSGIVDIVNNVNPNQTFLIVEGSTLAINTFNNGVFSIYPNPAKSVVNLQLKENLSVTLKSAIVYDLTGKAVVSFSDLNQPLNVEKLATGTYILSISDTQNRSYTQKFIKE